MADSGNSQVEQLVQEGIAAFKAGDRQLARGKLEAAVKVDSYSEKAWLWLARVVDTDEERRTCLGNVIIINPQNQQAQRMLDKLEGRAAKTSEDEEAVMGLPRRTMMMVLGMVVVIIILVAILFTVVLGGGEEEALLPTEFHTETPTPTPNVGLTETAQASITPTITPVSQAVIATWTPLPEPTDTPPPEQFPTPPPEVSGRIIMQSGFVAGDESNQPIVVVNPGDLSSKMIVSNQGQRGQNPALQGGANRFAWNQYSSGTRSLTLQIQSFGVPNSINVVTLYDNNPILSEIDHPDWFGQNLVFAGQVLGSSVRDIWLLEVPAVGEATPVAAFGSEPSATLPPTPIPPSATPTLEGATPPSPEPTAIDSPLTRVTDDAADNTYPAFDPTGTALVYVSVLDGITDLRVVNINSLQVFILTDNGNTLVESAPDWGGSNEVVFAASQGSAGETDIYIMSADGSAEPSMLFDFGPQDIQPRFSPDGRHIVFSSNRLGNWDVFIYDRETETFYGVETDPESIDIANGWGQ